MQKCWRRTTDLEAVCSVVSKHALILLPIIYIEIFRVTSYALRPENHGSHRATTSTDVISLHLTNTGTRVRL